jgi:hypothetical protein
MDQTTALVGTATKYAREDHVHPKYPAAPFDAMAYSGMQINGAIDISQEIAFGTSVTASGKYICDGWRLNVVGTPAGNILGAATQTLLFPGIPGTIYITVGAAVPTIAAGDLASIYQYIEGYRMQRLAWGTANAQPVTIAFWSMHSIPGTYSFAIGNVAGNRNYVTTYNQAAANVAQYNVITIPGDTGGTWPTGNAGAIVFQFAVACGANFIAPSANSWLGGGPYAAAPGQVNGIATTSGALRISGVVVLPGIEAPSAARSALIMRPYDQELVTCRRYFQKLGGSGLADILMRGYAATATTLISYPIPISPIMRAPPIGKEIGTWAKFNVTGALAFNAGPSSMGVQYQAAAIGDTSYYSQDATTYITLDARL